jgi:hypothetical protein
MGVVVGDGDEGLRVLVHGLRECMVLGDHCDALIDHVTKFSGQVEQVEWGVEVRYSRDCRDGVRLCCLCGGCLWVWVVAAG